MDYFQKDPHGVNYSIWKTWDCKIKIIIGNSFPNIKKNNQLVISFSRLKLRHPLQTNNYLMLFYRIIYFLKGRYREKGSKPVSQSLELGTNILTDLWFSGGVEAKKNPTELLGGLSDITPWELRPVPWFLKLLEKNRCWREDCCLWKTLCFLRELLLPQSSWTLLPPVVFSPAFIFDVPKVWLGDFKFRSRLSQLLFLRLDRLCFSSCWYRWDN